MVFCTDSLIYLILKIVNLRNKQVGNILQRYYQLTYVIDCLLSNLVIQILVTSIDKSKQIKIISISIQNKSSSSQTIMRRQEKENYVAHQKFYGGKIVSPHEMLCLLRKNQHNRMWILKQLSQLGIDIVLLQDYSLSDLYRHCDQIIKSTYSIKYLGMNENQMGIISRRIDPFKDNNFNLKQLPQATYTVNKFFFPKPLKVVRKQKKQEKINIQNLQTQIKKAFLKNNSHSLSLKNKTKSKLTINGSWVNNGGTKNKQNRWCIEQPLKIKSHSHSKHLTTNDKIQIPDASMASKKLANSYSRFLSNGLIFSSSRPTTSS